MGMGNFYDKMAKKFGGYAFSNSKSKYTSECPNGDPEQVFKEKLLELAGSECAALDIGCGDGKFAFEIANRFSEITGLDSSKELLAIAVAKMKEFHIENTSFVFGDAKNTPFKDASFNIIFNRRGPSFYAEYARLLKKGGYYVEIGIGEKDAMALKKVFGRGQNYGSWNESRLESDKKELEKVGFKFIFAKDYYCSEYYLSPAEFKIFLQGVPIFEDFDTNKDKKYLESYYKEYQKPKGIVLARHRVVYVARKI